MQTENVLCTYKQNLGRGEVYCDTYTQCSCIRILRTVQRTEISTIVHVSQTSGFCSQSDSDTMTTTMTKTQRLTRSQITIFKIKERKRKLSPAVITHTILSIVHLVIDESKIRMPNRQRQRLAHMHTHTNIVT